MPETVVAEDVRKAYGETTALAGVSLSLAAGEVFVLIGPNGAGKTTLVRALTGTTTPDAGQVSLLGEAPETVSKQSIGVLPQSFSPPERLTARELLGYYAGLYDDARDPEAVLSAVGLSGAADTWYEDLSGGQQRRVCLGAAIVNDPDVLFLDEPTTAIDPAGRRAVHDRIDSLAEGGTTVLVTTHDMDEAERLGDRVGLLVDGQLRRVGTPTSLVEEFGGDPRLVVGTEATTERVADALDGAYRVTRVDDDCHLYGVAPVDIGDVVARLEHEGVAYDRLTWREPGLEDVYLELTGESYAVDPEREAVAADGGRTGDRADRSAGVRR